MPVISPLPALDDDVLGWASVLRGTASAGWIISDFEMDSMTATLSVRQHQVAVKIRQEEDQVVVEYVSSVNLRCNPTPSGCSRIHKAYRAWINHLMDSIATSLAQPYTDEQLTAELDDPNGFGSRWQVNSYEDAEYERQQRLRNLLAAFAAARSGRSSGSSTPGNGIPVYDASQCVGPVIMGQCHGSTIGPPMKTCHGTMLNGQCTGPMF